VHIDLLFIVAEIGAAFAGFATLVAVVSDRLGRPPAQLRLYFRLLQNALIASLFSVAFAIVPAVVLSQGVEASVAWRASSGASFFVLASYMGYILPRLVRTFRAADQPVPLSFVANTLASAIWLLIFAACATGVFPASAYLVALTGILSVAGVAFLRFFLLLGRDTDAA
jgi:hypothetical protein